MINPYILIFGVQIHLYTLSLGLCILLSVLIILRVYAPQQRIYVFDLILFAFFGALVGGRLVHVLLNWAHFSYHTGEIVQLRSGGLDWHGAVGGSLLFLQGINTYFTKKGQSISLSDFLDKFTFLLPLLAMGAMFGCFLAYCAYGAEIEHLSAYPAFLVWQDYDVFGIFAPRFATQGLAVMGFVLLLMGTLLSYPFAIFYKKRFPLVLILISLILFLIGFLRGDYNPLILNLRADQWLDLIMIGFAVGWLWRQNRENEPKLD
ncbi:hypothetical protein MASR2M15_27490 [Anaerolineales bacterium]